ncbi:MAG TPA: hypothetical protein VFP80_13695 [Thermoanaerobaculia bacterium]|nr:hypothetical protein [Thermoanaerobaculia bacterium]
MTTFLITVIASLVAAALFAVPRYVAKRHFLLMALSNDIEFQRERLRHIQQTIQLVAANFQFSGPVVLPGVHQRRDRTTFSSLLTQAALYAPGIHLNIAAFDARIQDLEILFDDFKASLAGVTPNGADPSELAAYHEALGVRLFGLCDALLQNTHGRELAAFPANYGDALSNVRAQELLEQVYALEVTGRTGPRRPLAFSLTDTKARRLKPVIDLPVIEQDRDEWSAEDLEGLDTTRT